MSARRPVPHNVASARWRVLPPADTDVDERLEELAELATVNPRQWMPRADESR